MINRRSFFASLFSPLFLRWFPKKKEIDWSKYTGRIWTTSNEPQLVYFSYHYVLKSGRVIPPFISSKNFKIL